MRTIGKKREKQTQGIPKKRKGGATSLIRFIEVGSRSSLALNNLMPELHVAYMRLCSNN